MQVQPAEKTAGKTVLSKNSVFQQILLLIIGFICGAGCLSIAGILYLRSAFVQEMVSDEPYAQIVEKLPARVKQTMPGWQVSYEACMLPQLPDGRQLRVFKLCNRDCAASLLNADPRTAAILPCSFAVFERPDGKTGLVRVNPAFTSRLFGGEVFQLFSEKITRDQLILFRAIGFYF